tara:strand:+ start:936 stop:1361 length:426 start_codon:yes stop_codon:yes gene_type:complete
MNSYLLNEYFNDLNSTLIANVKYNTNKHTNILNIVKFYINTKLKFYYIVNNIPIVKNKQMLLLEIDNYKNKLINNIIMLLLKLNNLNLTIDDIHYEFTDIINEIKNLEKIISLVNLEFNLLLNIFICNITNNKSFIATYSN